MKKLLFLLTLAMGVASFASAQKIDTEKVFGGYKFTQDGKQLKMNDLVKIMWKNDKEAYEVIRKAQSSHTFAGIFSFAGGFLIGWPIGTAIGGGDPNWTLAGIGAGLVLLSIPISSGSNKKAKEAVELYNASLDATSLRQDKPEIRVKVGGDSIGFSVAF